MKILTYIIVVLLLKNELKNFSLLKLLFESDSRQFREAIPSSSIF